MTLDQKEKLSYFFDAFTKLSKQVTRCVDCFVLTLITNYNEIGDPRCLHYICLFGIEELLKDHFIILFAFHYNR